MKQALVTGSTRGIGAAIAQKLTKNGYQTFTNGRNGGSIPADLSTLEGINTLAKQILSKTEKLDCLVLNTGITCRTAFDEMSMQQWNEVMDTNVTLPTFLIQNLFDHIADNGSIVFIGSDMALYPHSISVVYGVTKSAVVALSRNLVKLFAPRGIRVNVICPGFIDTKWQKAKPEWLRTKIENRIGLKRFGTPDEVADMVWSVISNSYINGSIISIDGGYDIE